MRLAIVAPPGLVLVSLLTGFLALHPHRGAAPAAAPRAPHDWRFDIILQDDRPRLTCEQAHRVIVLGHVTGGVSHLQLAGPIIYTDVSTDQNGMFRMILPVDGNVCELLREPQDFSFSDGSMHVTYTVDFGR